jgi:ribosomal protein L14
MFQKNSFSIPSDSSGIFLVKIIQTYKSESRKHAKIGKFAKVVIKNTKTVLNKLKKKKSRSIIVRTCHTVFTRKSYYYKFQDNSVVLLKKRMNTRGKELYGPTSKELRIKKFKVAYRYVF